MGLDVASEVAWPSHNEIAVGTAEGSGSLCSRLLQSRSAAAEYLCDLNVCYHFTGARVPLYLRYIVTVGKASSVVTQLRSLDDEYFLLQSGDDFMHNGRARYCHAVSQQ